MKPIAAIFFVLVILSGCSGGYYRGINNNVTKHNSVVSGGLIEKGTSNWYNTELKPPLLVDTTYSIGRLSRQNLFFYGADGYIGDKDGWLYRIEPDKNKVEKLLKIDGQIGFSGCISNNSFYFSDLSGNLYSYDITSGKLSTQQADFPVYSKPVCGKQAYFLDSNQTLYAIEKGEILWNYHFIGAQIATEGDASPLIDGKYLVVATNDGFLYEIADGNMIQSVEVDRSDTMNATKDIDSPPVADILGNIYAVTVNGIIASFDKRFRFLWKTQGSPASAELILSPNELIIPGLDGTISSYDTDTGNLLWRLNISEKPLISSPIMLEKTIYQPTLDGYLYAISENGRILWKEKIDGSGFLSKPVFHNGFLYLAARDGIIYKLKSAKQK